MSLYRFIAAEKANHSVSVICRVLGVSRSGLPRLALAAALGQSGRRRRDHPATTAAPMSRRRYGDPSLAGRRLANSVPRGSAPGQAHAPGRPARSRPVGDMA